MDIPAALFSVANTVAGAVLGIVLPVIIDQIRYARRSGLLGSWRSAQYRPVGTSTIWVEEDVTIVVKLGRLRVSSNTVAYDARGKISKTKMIFGEWESTKPGAHATGHFELAIHPEGQILYGEMQYPTDTGGHTYAGWVLGRSDADLARAKQLLRTTRKHIFEPDGSRDEN